MAGNNHVSRGVGQYVAGIAATIIAGVLVAWLTGLLDRILKPKEPEIKITNVGFKGEKPGVVPVGTPGSKRLLHVTVENAGQITAEGCRLWTDFNETLDTSLTNEFALKAGKSIEHTIELLLSGKGKELIRVKCRNHKAVDHYEEVRVISEELMKQLKGAGKVPPPNSNQDIKSKTVPSH